MAETNRSTLQTRVRQGAGTAVVATVANVAYLHAVGQAALGLGAGVTLLVASASAGAVGGVVFYHTTPLRERAGWRKTVADVLTLLAFCLAVSAILFLATVSMPE